MCVCVVTLYMASTRTEAIIIDKPSILNCENVWRFIYYFFIWLNFPSGKFSVCRKLLRKCIKIFILAETGRQHQMDENQQLHLHFRDIFVNERNTLTHTHTYPHMNPCNYKVWCNMVTMGTIFHSIELKWFMSTCVRVRICVWNGNLINVFLD